MNTDFTIIQSLTLRFLWLLAVLAMEVSLVAPFVGTARAGDWRVDEATGVEMKLEKVEVQNGAFIEQRLRMKMLTGVEHVIERSTDLLNWTRVGTVYGMGQEVAVPMLRQEVVEAVIDPNAPPYVEPSYPSPLWRVSARVQSISTGGTVVSWSSLEGEGTVRQIFSGVDFPDGRSAWGMLGEWGEVTVSSSGMALDFSPGSTPMPFGKDAEVKAVLDRELAGWIALWANHQPQPAPVDAPQVEGMRAFFRVRTVTDLDTDFDTLSDYDEWMNGTDPFSPDTDGDGVHDARERELGTDPTKHGARTDSDGDGLMDNLDADPGDSAVRWARTSSPGYVAIGLGKPIEDPDFSPYYPDYELYNLGLKDLSEDGQVLAAMDFWETATYWNGDGNPPPSYFETKVWSPVYGTWSNALGGQDNLRATGQVFNGRGDVYGEGFAAVQSGNTWVGMKDVPVVWRKGSVGFDNAELHGGGDEEMGSVFPDYAWYDWWWAAVHVRFHEFRRSSAGAGARLIERKIYGEYHLGIGYSSWEEPWVSAVLVDGEREEMILVGEYFSSFFDHTARIDSAGCTAGWMGVSVALPDGNGGHLPYTHQLRKVDRYVAGVGSGSVGRVVNAPTHQNPVSRVAEVSVSNSEEDAIVAVVWQTAYQQGQSHLVIGYGAPEAGDLVWHESSRSASDPLRLKGIINARGEALKGSRLWRNGEWIELDNLFAAKGWAELLGIDINDSGWILATGRKTNEEGNPVGEREAVLFAAMEYEFVEVDADGVPTGVEGVPSLSMPSPVIAVNSMTVDSSFDGNGNPIGSLTMDVEVTSAACDMIRGEELGAVNELQVFVNGEDEAFATVTLNVSKTENNESRALARFPFTGAFSGTVIGDLPMVEGTNTIELRAVDPSSGLAGLAWSSFELRIDRPVEDGGVIVPPGGDPPGGAVRLVSMRLSAEELPQDDQLDAMEFTLIWDDGTEVDYPLMEAAIDGNTFVSSGDLVTVAWDEETGIATLNASTLGLADVLFELRVDVTAGGGVANNTTGGGGASEPISSSVTLGETSEDGTIYQAQMEQDGATEGGFVRGNFVRIRGLEFLPQSVLENNMRFGFGTVNAAEGEVANQNLMIHRDAELGADYLMAVDEVLFERPVVVFFTPPSEGGNIPSDADIEKELRDELASLGESLGDAWQFRQGFESGMKAGGQDMIVGTGEVIYSGIDYAVGKSVSRLTLMWSGVQATVGNEERALELYEEARWTEQTNAQIEERWKKMAESAGALAEATWTYGEDFAVLMAAGLSDQEESAFDEADRLGETNQLIQLIGGELLAHAAKELKDATPHERGYFMGRVCFELIMAIGPVAAAKADKVKVLEKLDSLDTPADLKGAKAGIYAGLLNKARFLIAKLLHTPQCFVAGTPVLVRVEGGEFRQDLQDDAGLDVDFGRKEAQKAQKWEAGAGWRESYVPIERVTAGMEVWSRDEMTGRMGWRKVARTEESFTDEVVVVGIDADGDGSVDEELRGTDIHPFYVAGAGWVEMGALAVGDVLNDAEGSHRLRVASVTRERAPPGEWIATYNFDVEGWQSYHVGNCGAWVHNGTKLATCRRMTAMFDRMRALPSAAGETEFETLVRMSRFLESRNGLATGRTVRFGGDVWGRTAAHTTQLMLDGYAGPGDLVRFPTVKAWTDKFFKGRTRGGVEVHHSVEKYIQDYLEIPTSERDLCPGIAMPRKKTVLDQLNSELPEGNALKAVHRGAADDGGLSPTLQKAENIPTNLIDPNKQEVIRKLRDIYCDNPDWENLWPVTRDWLRKLKAEGKLVPDTLWIPEDINDVMP